MSKHDKKVKAIKRQIKDLKAQLKKLKSETKKSDKKNSKKAKKVDKKAKNKKRVEAGEIATTSPITTQPPPANPTIRVVS